jgi:tetratricopeptide (TPR) repeat protein
MSNFGYRFRLSVLAVTFSTMSMCVAFAQEQKLGTVDFPTSGSKEAQAHFLRGLAALHSFWYEEALDAFRDSTKSDPSFMMGYWGEAMAHNHPLWSQQDTEAARKVLKNIKESGKLTARERAYIEAVKVLYGEGDKLARDNAYSKAMEKLRADYPGDLEAAAFYSLSLLGTVRPGDRGFSRQAKAGALALDIYQKNPNHPGAAHYIIHSFDDPEHAILALPAAHRYAEIAPEAHHARHMPSHIFLQLGMWREAAASNESSWAASDAWVKRKGLAISLRDYHSLSWLNYVYLQQGRYTKAELLIAMLGYALKESPDARMRRTYNEMVTTFAIETERWDSLTRHLGSAAPATGAQPQTPTAPAVEHQHGASPAPRPGAATPGYGGGPGARIPFARGFAAAVGDNLASVDGHIAELAAVRKRYSDSGDAYLAKQVEIMELELSALVSAKKGRNEEAIATLKKAVGLEESLSPPSGPPDLIKPSHELFGEVLLRAGKPAEAAQQFAKSLERQPNRARSLLGAARAAEQTGDKAAAQGFFSALAEVWQQADAYLLEGARDKGGKSSPK